MANGFKYYKLNARALVAQLRQAGLFVGNVRLSSDLTIAFDWYRNPTEAQIQDAANVIANYLVAGGESDAFTWDDVRRYRDLLLAESDWTQGNDSPLTPAKKNEWKDYRQLLRDIPDDYPTPDDVVWPTAPSEST